MGLWSWWGTANPAPNNNNNNDPNEPSASPTSSPQNTETRPPPQQPPQPRTATAKLDALDREELALEELRSWFDKSSREASSPTTSTDKNNNASTDPFTSTTDASASDSSAPQVPESDSLYPDKLSCSACFDAAYYCSSIGGQLTNVYRYGGLRSCSDLWAQWRFCMRTKSMGDEERRRRVREWNRDKEVRRRVARNSEEVWELRGKGELDQDGAPGIGRFVPVVGVVSSTKPAETTAGGRGWESEVPAFVPGNIREDGTWVGGNRN